MNSKPETTQEISIIDNNGYRANVGIVLMNNNQSQVFLAKRCRQNAWQFPQGGLKRGEDSETAMYRELHEEVGLLPHQVSVVAVTKGWHYYDVPKNFLRHNAPNRSVGVGFRGQKQRWYLLHFLANDNDISLTASMPAEFDAWRWVDYWQPIEWVVYFKKDVYRSALQELSVFAFPNSDSSAHDAQSIANSQ